MPKPSEKQVFEVFVFIPFFSVPFCDVTSRVFTGFIRNPGVSVPVHTNPDIFETALQTDLRSRPHCSLQH